MASKTEKTASRSPADRLKSFANAAFTADETVVQMADLVTSMNAALSGMGGTMEYTENTLRQLNESLVEIDRLAPRLFSLVDRMEAIVDRVERIIGVAEVATTPISVAESAVRGVVGVLTPKLSNGSTKSKAQGGKPKK